MLLLTAAFDSYIDRTRLIIDLTSFSDENNKKSNIYIYKEYTRFVQNASAIMHRDHILNLINTPTNCSGF